MSRISSSVATPGGPPLESAPLEVTSSEDVSLKVPSLEELAGVEVVVVGASVVVCVCSLVVGATVGADVDDVAVTSVFAGPVFESIGSPQPGITPLAMTAKSRVSKERKLGEEAERTIGKA
jgi:hypothetical protein